MIRISQIAFLGTLLLCISWAQGKDGKFYMQEGATAKIIFVVKGASSGVTCNYPGRDHLRSKAKYWITSFGVNVLIQNAKMEDAGDIECTSSQGGETVELVVYNETSEVRDIQVEAVSGTQLSISWRAPLKNPDLVGRYFIMIYDSKMVDIKATVKIEPVSDTGFEKHVVDNFTPAASNIVIATYYKSGQSGRSTNRGPTAIHNITADLWSGPKLSIRAVALAPGTVLVSLQVLDSDNVTDLQTSFLDGSPQNWTDFEMDSNERFVILNDLQPETTYFFKAKAVLRLGPKEAVTHVLTPRSATPVPSKVEIELDSDSSFVVKWQQERSDGVKGYTVTVEEQQADQSYIVRTEKTTTAQELKIDGISEDLQYRVTVRNFDLNGLGAPSEAALYPEMEDTASAAECPTTAPESVPVVPEESKPTEASDTSYALDVRVIKQTPTRFRIMWFLPTGDLDNVDKFQITLTSSSGKILINSKQRKNQRSIGLHPMSPDASYTFSVKALDFSGNVLIAKDVAVVPDSTEGSSDPELLIYISEIRDEQARLAFNVKNLDLSKLKNYRLTVRQGGPDGPVVLKRSQAPSKQMILLSELPANRVYYVVVETIGQDDQTFLSSALTLKTPPVGEVGESVSGSPLPTKPATIKPTEPPFTKNEAQLKVFAFEISNGVGKVSWEDDGKPIPPELKKDVPVLVGWSEIVNGQKGPPRYYTSIPGATEFRNYNLNRFSTYEVRAKYDSEIPGVLKNVWSIARRGSEKV